MCGQSPVFLKIMCVKDPEKGKYTVRPAESVFAEINLYCGDLMKSGFLEPAKKQVHHGRTTLYRHIMSVACYAVLLCDYYERRGRNVDRKRAIVGAVCHDLGMVGRHELYSNRIEAWLCHPRVSVEAAGRFFPDIDSETEKIIRKHMWPLTVIPPLTAEEWIVVMADKAASFDDVTGKSRLPFTVSEQGDWNFED